MAHMQDTVRYPLSGLNNEILGGDLVPCSVMRTANPS